MPLKLEIEHEVISRNSGIQERGAERAAHVDRILLG